MYPINFTKLDNCLATAEKSLNVAGWIPLVSSVSGPLRVVAGKVMMLAAGLTAAAMYTGSYFTKNQELTLQADRFVVYIEHGFANIVRGLIETVAFIGNFVTFCYDQDAEARMFYPNEFFDGVKQEQGHSHCTLRVGRHELTFTHTKN